MYKVILIDDEPIIRTGMKNIIHWKQFNCEVVGEAEDGQDGLNLIKETIPDIIITDIRMPELDGLDMVKGIKDIVPNSKIIILTGYRDFDYVHEAIKLGAFDFVLKPSKIEEITSVVSKAVQELDKQKKEFEEIEKIKILYEQNLPLMRERLLYDIIYKIVTKEDEIDNKMDLFGIELKEFVMIIVESDDDFKKETSQYDIHLYQFGIINTFEKVFSKKPGTMSITLNNKQIAFIIQDLSEGIEKVNSKCEEILKMIHDCFGFTVTISISREGKGHKELVKNFEECKNILKYKFYIGDNSIINYTDIDPFYKQESNESFEDSCKMIIEGIKTGNETLVKEKTDEIFVLVSKMEDVGLEYIKGFYKNTVEMINIKISINNNSCDAEEKIEVLRSIGESNDINELNTILKNYASKITLEVNCYNNKKIKLALKRAMDYIQDHYNEQLTLKQVSEKIYLSSYYISRLFKKELGKNFVDYLNEIRIDKAKELLNDIKFKSYEIAEMVGISDAHYFSKLFKKYVGMAPTEYREFLSNKSR